MSVKEAVTVLLDHIEEWAYEDRGYDYNACPSCGWNTKEDRTDAVALGHRPGCKLRAALDELEAFVKSDQDGSVDR